jgi:metallo-beta-lactamase class B
MHGAAAVAVVAGLLAAQPDAGTPPPSLFGRGTNNVLGGALGPDGGVAGSSSAPRGSLDKEIIRRIIRRHINEVRSCYERELTAKPELAGRILVQFTIAASGQVVASVLQSSTMDNARVESCTVQAVRRWEFPKPVGGGTVNVVYPFVLTPAAPVSLLPGGKDHAGAVEIEAIDARTFVHRSTDAHGVPANGLVAVTDQGLLLFDTGWTEAQTEAVLRWGESTFKRRWLGAVITHDHADRDGGIAALFRRGILVEALDLTAAKLRQRGVRSVATLFKARAGEIKDRRGFEAFYPGPGHAPDNIVIALPAHRVVFGGCLIKAADAKDLGFTGDADLAAWPEAVRRVAKRYADEHTVVPGHGAVDTQEIAYQHTLDLLGAAAAARAAAH